LRASKARRKVLGRAERNENVPLRQVAREVFNSCLMGELAAKTRVLVTNQLQFVSAADTVIFMAGGQIAETGTYADMMAAGKAFTQLMAQAEARGAARGCAQGGRRHAHVTLVLVERKESRVGSVALGMSRAAWCHRKSGC